MARQPAPSVADLKLLDPDGSFRARLAADRAMVASLDESGDLRELREIVHRLAGAAGTFGYPELGDVAIELDEAFRDGRPVRLLDLARILAALEQALGVVGKSA